MLDTPFVNSFCSIAQKNTRFQRNTHCWSFYSICSLARADCEGGDVKRFGFSHLPLFDEGEYGVAFEIKSPHAPLKL
jgi:hypothetical protein